VGQAKRTHHLKKIEAIGPHEAFSKKCYDTAKKLRYLASYEIDIPGTTTPLDRLTFNPEKFKRMNKVEKEQKRLWAKTRLTTLFNRPEDKTFVLSSGSR
jgi:hypothetical protein